MTQRYVLLPRTGLIATEGSAARHLNALNRAYEREAGGAVEIDGVVVRVDDAQPDGPALVSMSEQDAQRLEDNEPELRALPDVVYPHPRHLALSEAAAIRGGDAEAFGAGEPIEVVEITITCIDAQSRTPLLDVQVVAYVDLPARLGAEAQTDATGRAVLVLPAGRVIERLCVYTAATHWGCCHDGLALADHVVPIEAVDASAGNVLQHYYPASEAEARFDRRTGVIVGVIDSGVGPHDGLAAEGFCTVTGLPADDYADVSGHGTHVAGVIGAPGALAPGVVLKSYRVFPDKHSGATSYAILKALMFAVRDRCDIVNLSLGGGTADPIVAEAIIDARQNGVLIVAATGNDGQEIVRHPAAYEGVVAVGAFGRRGTFPATSSASGDIRDEPVGDDAAEFMASFSNTGARVDLIAPGVGVLSTLPDNGYGALSGTSMAAPVVAGVAACLLSRDRELFAAPRNFARSEALKRKLLASGVSHGFGERYEGRGRPQA